MVSLSEIRKGGLERKKAVGMGEPLEQRGRARLGGEQSQGLEGEPCKEAERVGEGSLVKEFITCPSEHREPPERLSAMERLGGSWETI